MPDLADVLAGAVGGTRAPGAVAVVQRTGVEATVLSAHADASQLFEIGSVAKTMTAVLVLQHVQRGQVGLDDPIVTHLPKFRLAEAGAAEQITIRQLLTHTSGIDCGDDFTDTGNGDDCLERYVHEVLSDVGLINAPGERWSYSNGGFSLLGRLVEVLDGHVWDDALIERVFVPLGLSATTASRLDSGRNVARGHRYDPVVDAVVDEPRRMPRSAGPAGNVVATAADLVTFAQALFSGEGSLLSSELAAEMISPTVEMRQGGQGLAWVVARPNVAAHGGATLGCTAFLATIPGFGSLSVVANGPGAGAMAGELQAVLFGVPIDREPAPGTLVEVEPEACAGRFVRRHVLIDLSHHDGELIATSQFSGPIADLYPDPEPAVLEPAGGGRFLSKRPYEDAATIWDFDDVDRHGIPARLLTTRLLNRVS